MYLPKNDTSNTLLIKNKTKDYILQETFAEKNKINDDTLVFKEGYFDSMGLMRLIAFIEENFGVKISDDDLVEDNFESIDAVTAFIVRKLQ